MRQMLDGMVGFDRLSTTFRFNTGSARLDERALTDLERLTGHLENLPAGTAIKLVGFTDGRRINRRVEVWIKNT